MSISDLGTKDVPTVGSYILNVVKPLWEKAVQTDTYRNIVKPALDNLSQLPVAQGLVKLNTKERFATGSVVVLSSYVALSSLCHVFGRNRSLFSRMGQLVKGCLCASLAAFEIFNLFRYNYVHEGTWEEKKISILQKYQPTNTTDDSIFPPID